MKILLCACVVLPLLALAVGNVRSENEKGEKLKACLDFSHHLRREAVIFKTPINKVIESFPSPYFTGVSAENLAGVLDELSGGDKCGVLVNGVMSASAAEVEARCEELEKTCAALLSENEEKSKGRKAAGVFVPVFAALLAVIIML